MPTKKPSQKKTAERFESVKVESIFEVLDAVAWLDIPTSKNIAQFAGVDPRTAGKILKNARLIGLVATVDEHSYVLTCAYPYKGTKDQKQAVIKEALLKLPLVVTLRQFMTLGNSLEIATRKASTVTSDATYDPSAVAPLIRIASTFGALDLAVRMEALVQDAVDAKLARHSTDADKRVAFISHSSKDKPFVRQLASDLVKNGVQVWLDEQRIRVGDSIPEKVAQGLAESDFFLLVSSEHSANSEWVKKELNNALVGEIERRRVTVLPLKLDGTALPSSIADKRYADFSGSYANGLDDLIASMNSHSVVGDKWRTLQLSQQRKSCRKGVPKVVLDTLVSLWVPQSTMRRNSSERPTMVPSQATSFCLASSVHLVLLGK